MLVEVSILRRIFALLRGIRIHPAYLLIPVLLGMGAAVFEGASLGLLIPLLNGFLTRDFSFLKELPVVGDILVRVVPISILGSDRLLFILLIGVFIVSVILKNILRYASVLSMRYVGVRAHHHLRKNVFQRILSFGKFYFDEHSVGYHSAVIMTLAKSAIRPLLVIDKHINAFFSFAMYIVVMMMISWKVTLFALPIFLLLHISVRSIIKAIHRYSYEMAKNLEYMTEKGIEILSNIPLVKSYDMEESEKRLFADISDESARVEFRGYRVAEIILPFQELLTLFSALILFSAMLYLLVLGGETNPSSFIVYFYVVLNAASKFGTLTGFRSTIAEAVGGLAETEEIFRDTGKHFVPSGKREFTGLKRDMEFRHLTFEYGGGREVLSDVSFKISHGEMVAIVGPTGSGKTTIVNLLMRFYDCPPGSLFVDGVDIRDFSTGDLHRHMALVSQDAYLFHDTLRKNITYGLSSVSDQDLSRAVERARLSELVRKLPAGFETIVGDRGTKLSGGEKQRISIARALLKGAEILILDEATSSLDSRTEKLIQEAINEAVKEKTAIVIAHRLSTIKDANQVVVVSGGRVVEQGSPEELLRDNGLFRLLWEEQMMHS